MKNKIILMINDLKLPKNYNGILNIFPKLAVIESYGFYNKKIATIKEICKNNGRCRVIIELINKKMNAFELMNILDLPYALISQYVDTLSKFKLITSKKGISKNGRSENTLKIHPDVEIVLLSDILEKK